MADPIKRLNYFKHQFLRASDFIDEQKYHVDMRRRHNRTLHTWGIAGSGLKVTFAQGATAVTVSQGTAIDSQGREIVLTEDKLVDLSGFTAGAALYITIAYGEKQTNPSNETGAEGNTRWAEEPVITPTQAKPGDVSTSIVLGRVTRNGTTVTAVDESERRSAGVEAGDLTVRTLTLSRQTVDAGAWPRLTCAAANQAALENSSLKVDNGREIFFADGGQLRSFDNAHRIVFNRPNNRLELQEFGDIAFMTGGANPAERMRVGANGNVGIGVGGTADAPLHIAGGQWDLTNTEGDLKIGNAALRLKMSVALGGGGAGDARIRAMGGTNRLMLGAGTSDTLTILGGNVGLGTVTPGTRLEINGDLLFKADPGSAEDPGDIIFQSASGAQKARLYTPPTPGAGLLFAVGDNTSRLAINAAGNVAIGANFTNPQADLHISSDEPHIRIDTTGNRSVIQWARKGALLWDCGVGRDATNTDFWFGDFSAYRFIMQKGTGFIGIGPNVVPQRILHAEGTEVHSGGAGGGLSFASRDTNGGAFVENGAGGSRWVLYAAGGVARLWSAGDKLNVKTNGDLTITGALYAGNSDIYFTEVNHNHTGIGNTAGYAAIENATNYGGLMILGRMVPNVGRVVKLWDVLEVNGNLTVTGVLRAPSKVGFVVDDFINRHGEALEQGDVVVIGENQSSLFYGLKGNLPVPEVDLAADAYDTRVCGIVDELTVATETPTPAAGAEAEAAQDDDKAAKKSKKKEAHKEAEPPRTTGPMQTFTSEEVKNLDATKVGPDQFGTMVTHGSYAFCKVDADIAPIKVGDVLTTSPTKGHAQKVLDPSKAAGAVIGKALASLKKGKGKIPVLVTLQ
jgi:hypothetical protein